MKRTSHYILLAFLVFGLASCATRRGGKGKGCDCPGFGYIDKKPSLVSDNTTFRV